MLTRSVRKVHYDPTSREVRVVVSDESVDRYGDIIRVSGWDLKHFKKNPVLLWAHDSRSPPIGTVPEIGKEMDGGAPQLVATAKLLPEGTYDFADLIGRILEADALRATSVGFLPTKEPKPIIDKEAEFVSGFEFVGQELLELSIVPVPANPAALALAKGLSLDARDIYRVFVDPSQRLQKKRTKQPPRVDDDDAPPRDDARMQAARVFSRELLEWEREKMRRVLRLQNVI